jgi:hypothetical protein
MKNLLAIGIAMAAGLIAHAEDCNVTVYVQAGSNQGAILLGAERTATAMFREIGVEVRFRNGAVPAHAADDSCGAPIVMEIENHATGFPVSEDAVAFAAPYSSGGTSIHVFADRILKGNGVQFATVLFAHALAHEITHVLEGTCRHSTEGVLKARWDRQDDDRMMSHPLPFAAIDMELIHRGIARRMRQAVTE